MKIKIDSRCVKKHDTFIAIKTLHNDGHMYIEDAIKNGATKIVCEHGKYSVPTVIVKDTRKYLSNYLKKYYYKKIKNLKLIGVTGTNGKTTTSFSIYQALNNIGIKCAYIGTIGVYMDDFVCTLNNTTPELLDIYEMLLKCEENNYEYVVMEVSSHALSLGRVDGLLFDTAIFTNISTDHLDYHKTIDDYAHAKQKLFYMCNKAIVNVDDKYSYLFILNNNKNYTYGKSISEYMIKNIKLYDKYTKFSIIHNEEYKYKTTLLGEFNVYNLTNVIVLLSMIGIDYKTIKNAILNIKPPKGRMDIIHYKDSIIVIDYAHTPDAVSKVINTVKSFSKNKIYTIIGCGGNRDKTKRPVMANIAVNNTDFAIFTSDNPREEKQSNIFKDMTSNIKNDNYVIINDRKAAIKYGINLLKKNDILLVLGKGHEDYQIIGNKKIHFDDKEIVLDFIKNDV